MGDVALLTGDDLNFDMPRLLDVFLEIDAAVFEGLLGLLARGGEAGAEADVVAGHAHAAPTAARRRLDQHRETHRVGEPQGVVLILDQAFATGDDGDAGLLGQLPRRGLVAEHGHRFVRRTDELDLASAANFGEVRVFGEKPVAWMDGLDVGDFGSADDAWDVKVALGRRRRSDADGFVGQIEVGRAAVRLAEHRDHFNAQVAAGADHPQRDLATVAYEDALEHRPTCL